ncbi:MAG TPA: hypothetical protein VFL55_25275, partial [Acetobacteraceae bacterium]|nr:hypothetical protein [Acetobacteraceae bacterium]
MAANGISTVMMKGIFDEMAEGHQLPKRVAQDLLSSMIEKVTQHLKQGDRIRIRRPRHAGGAQPRGAHWAQS